MRTTTSIGRTRRAATSSSGHRKRHGIRPNQRSDSEPADQQQREPGACEQRRELERLGLDDEAAADVVVDRGQVGLVGGGVVRAVGLSAMA